MENFTPTQRRRINREKHVCDAYLKLREKFPKATNARIVELLSKNYKVSFSTIRKILINGLANEYVKHNKN